MQKGEEGEEKRKTMEKKKKKTETTVPGTPVPFAHRLELCTETAAEAIKKKDFFHLPLLPLSLFPHSFASETSKKTSQQKQPTKTATSSCTDEHALQCVRIRLF